MTYVHSVLKSALENAVRENELPRNVARNVKTTAPRPRRFQPLTATEARQLLQAASDDRLHALYELALRTGLRKGELLGMHWEDLDLDSGTASIHRSLQRTRTGGLTTLHTKTRASERRIALPTEYINSLKRHRERQEEERNATKVGWKDSGLIFTTPTGGPLDPANMTRRFGRLLDRAGLRRIRFHDLRHSTATLLLEQGVDLVVIKELLGHAHIGVTAGVYAHVRFASNAKPSTPWAAPSGRMPTQAARLPAGSAALIQNGRWPHEVTRGAIGIRLRCRQRCRQNTSGTAGGYASKPLTRLRHTPFTAELFRPTLHIRH